MQQTLFVLLCVFPQLPTNERCNVNEEKEEELVVYEQHRVGHSARIDGCLFS